MPSFTALALERLLEQGGSGSAAGSKMERRSSVPVLPSHTKPVEAKADRPQMSPALYATPAFTPLPDSSTSFPPSPYMVNHKRQGPRLQKSSSDAIVAKGIVTKSSSMDAVFAEPNCVEEEEEVSGEAKDVERESETEDFFDPRESTSFASDTDGEEVSSRQPARTSTSMGVFYDASEELSSDGERPQASVNDLQSEIHELNLSLTMEVDKRKQAEEALNNMQRRWQTLREGLTEVGLAIPVELSTADLTEDICQQIREARLVAESFGRAAAKAECEEEMEAQLESKNFEISRLCDRLHYYETMNREMSQRNQEGIELVRRDRRKTRMIQNLAWGSIFAAVALGGAALAWSYIPSTEGLSPLHQPHPFEPDTTSE